MNRTGENLGRMQAIFNDMQNSDARVYSEFIREMTQILLGGDILEDFCNVLNTVLVCKRVSIPQKISNFLRRMFEDLSEVPAGLQVVLSLLSYLLGLTESKITKVRKNSLFILKLIIDIPRTKVAITDAFLAKICERLFDREKSIRREALKVLSNYQDVQLNQKIKILNLFKDITRHDPSHEVRSLALHVISVEPSTYNCVIERCADVNASIRKLFYTRCLPSIDLLGLSLGRRVFLLEKSILEREFDGKGYFLDALFSTFKLPEDLKVLNASLYDRGSLKYLEIVLREVFERMGCESSFEYLLTDPSQENTFLARVELAYIEETIGRDNLNLPELEAFVTVMYQSCSSILELEGSERRDQIETMKNLFRIARFYDFFNETARKYILSTIYKLLAKNSVEEVVEEAIQMSALVCDKDIDGFVGSVINKNMSSSQKVCLMVCKQVMKHIRPIGELHEAVINEIVIPNIGKEMSTEALGIGFYYILDRQNEMIKQALVDNMRNDVGILHMCVDLAISFCESDLLASLLDCIREMLSIKNEDVIIPASKLVLSRLYVPEDLENQFIEFAFQRYYNTEDDHLKQYCTVLFYELFISDSTPLIKAFCNVLGELTHSHRIFIDQSMYWICNSAHPNGSQELFYEICICLSNSGGRDQNRRLLFGVLEKIEIISCWDAALTKKILFCCSSITKRIGSKFNLGEMIGRLMEIDDGEPISQKDLHDVKRDLGVN